MKHECDEFLALASGAVDGLLGAAESDRLAAHLESCAACRSQLERLRHATSHLAAARAIRAPADLRERCVVGLVAVKFSWSRLAAGLLIGGGLFATGAWLVAERSCENSAKVAVDHVVRVIGAEPDEFAGRAELALVRALHSKRKR